MQTFLPYPDYHRSARVLDRQRLGKQCVECGQIYDALQKAREGRRVGWINHPATLMWKGYTYSLVFDWLHMSIEWGQRGYQGHGKVFQIVEELGLAYFPQEGHKHVDPPWLGNDKFHASHRAALLAKLPEHYGQFGWQEQPKIEYWWPTKNGY